MDPSLNSSEDYLRVLLLSVPLVIGGIIHMVAVKSNVLFYLKKPIHQRWFGENKTWRGFFIMPLATFPGVLLARYLETLTEANTQVFTQNSIWLLSLLLGLGYCLAELPNSFIKRRLGVKEGQTSKKFKWFFIVLDQADSVIGCLLAYKLVAPISWGLFLKTIIFGTVLHLVINLSLYKAKIRKNPF